MPIAGRAAALVMTAVLAGACTMASTTPPADPTLRPTASDSSVPPALGDRYVAPDGDDAADGSAAHPWRSLQRAAEEAIGTVHVAAGSYDGFRLTRSGSAEQPIRFQGPGDRTAVLTAKAGSPDVITLDGVSHVQIVGLTITGASEKYAAGILIAGASSAVTVEGNQIRDNTSFGVEVTGGDEIRVVNNEISGNEAGVRVIEEVPAAVGSVRIEQNLIHDNDRLVVNDAFPDNDFGANGVIVHGTTSRVEIRGNTMYGNRGASVDYGTDGGGVEVFAASNVEIRENVFRDNENVVETGTNGPPCANLSITRNVAYHTAGQPRASGLILRCASDSLVAHNTVVDLGWFAFYISHEDGSFGGSVAGLRVVNNIVADGRAYVIETPLPADTVLDYNLLDPSIRISAVAPTIARVAGAGAVSTLDQFRELTGQEQHGISGRPDFVSAGEADFQLAPGSPGIDQGLALAGMPYQGSAPDIGRFESPAG